jgi:hypothetical protein
MDVMSVYMEASKDDRQKIRKAMLVEADKLLKPLYPVTAQRHAAARVMVDRALEYERCAEAQATTTSNPN